MNYIVTVERGTELVAEDEVGNLREARALAKRRREEVTTGPRHEACTLVQISTGEGDSLEAWETHDAWRLLKGA